MIFFAGDIASGVILCERTTPCGQSRKEQVIEKLIRLAFSASFVRSLIAILAQHSVKLLHLGFNSFQFTATQLLSHTQVARYMVTTDSCTKGYERIIRILGLSDLNSEFKTGPRCMRTVGP
jgi:hypothetical protein